MLRDLLSVPIPSQISKEKRKMLFLSSILLALLVLGANGGVYVQDAGMSSFILRVTIPDTNVNVTGLSVCLTPDACESRNAMFSRPGTMVFKVVPEIVGGVYFNATMFFTAGINTAGTRSISWSNPRYQARKIVPALLNANKKKNSFAKLPSLSSKKTA